MDLLNKKLNFPPFFLVNQSNRRIRDSGMKFSECRTCEDCNVGQG